MVMKYDAKSASFLGIMKNVTEQPIKAVRIEVHFSNGVELGPTKRIDLASGQIQKFCMSATGQRFKTWKAHAKSGEGTEHGHGGEGEHGGRGEHG